MLDSFRVGSGGSASFESFDLSLASIDLRIIIKSIIESSITLSVVLPVRRFFFAFNGVKIKNEI